MDRQDASPDRARVVIVGGGFAGLHSARALRGAEVEITLVDRRNHHLFQPLLYQVATAGLSAPDIAAPLRGVLRDQPRTTVLLAEVRRIDLELRRLHLDGGALEYDFLILAPGSEPQYFGNDAWEKHAPGLKSLEDAIHVRSRLLGAFEAAERETHSGERDAWLTFAIIGAGPTGVELAGALRDIARRTLIRDFRRFDASATRVVLIEAKDRLLPGLDDEVSARARSDLEAMGVEVRTGSAVSDIDEKGVTLEGGGTDRLTHRHLGSGGRAITAGRSAGHAHGQDRPGPGPGGSLPARPSRGLRGRRSGAH